MSEFWDMDPRGILQDLFRAAINSAAPERVLLSALPDKPAGKCIVVGAGKASAAMAAALESAWPDVDIRGVVVTRYGHGVPTSKIRIVEAAHPVSDSMSELASMLILESVKDLSAQDCVIALISGGGSALMALPRQGITLADKQSINKALLRSGASIGEINIVRKHLSGIKGGRLALAALPARMVTLVISDVPGDDPADIASGPTVPDSSSAEDAQKILDRYGIAVPANVAKVLATPRPAVTSRDIHPDVRLIASPSKALQAVADEVRHLGFTPLILGDALEGESAQLGIVMAGIVRSIKRNGLPVKPPVAIISGGETTVTLQAGSAGRGGRNTEFLLGLANALNGEPGVWAMAGDSDGIDGTEDAAGAIITPNTLKRGYEAGLNAQAFMARHDSYGYFDATGDLVKTGPTLTNVNDIRIIIIP